MKNTRRVKFDKVQTGGARTQRGLPDDVKARIAYLNALTAFLERMQEDPRFVWLYGSVEE